jgi:hypothetical protein
MPISYRPGKTGNRNPQIGGKGGLGEDILQKAKGFLTHPEMATQEDIRRMAARLLDDQRSDPMRARPPNDPQAPPSRFARFRGHAGKGLSTDEIMAMTRGEH